MSGPRRKHRALRRGPQGGQAIRNAAAVLPYKTMAKLFALAKGGAALAADFQLIAMRLMAAQIKKAIPAQQAARCQPAGIVRGLGAGIPAPTCA